MGDLVNFLANFVAQLLLEANAWTRKKLYS